MITPQAAPRLPPRMQRQGLSKREALRMTRGCWAALLLLSASAALHGAEAASSKDDWSNEACSEKTKTRWCAPWLRDGGWTLRYRSTNPEDLVDVFWLIEVWVKGSDALVCEYKGGRGTVRSNGCYSAVEVE